MNERTVAILLIAASALLAAICYVRGSADYEKSVAEVRECQLAGGGDRECWRDARTATQHARPPVDSGWLNVE